MKKTASIDFKSLALKFIGMLVKSDFKAATDLFDDQMKSLIPEFKLKDSWLSFTGESGNLLEMNVTKFVEQGSLRIVIVQCKFERIKLNVNVVFNDQGRISGLNLIPAEVPYNSPDYVNESLFKEVSITVGAGEWELPGTLTLPNNREKCPGVVLVHGSGPQDRDETIGPNKVFRDLAWGLASQGIGVLRYEKRTLEHSNKFTPELIAGITINEEVVEDALSAIQVLREHSGITDVYLLGHSLGASVAPLIGEKAPYLAGLIMMAGIIRPLEDVILDQFTYLYNLTGSMSQQQKTDLENLREQVQRVKDPNLSDSVPSKMLPLGVSPAYWLALRNYSPKVVIKNLSMPILILQGGRDYQVLPGKDFTGWRNVLKNSSNASFKCYPSLNHLFIGGEGESTPQEYNIEGHVSLDVIKTISEWIRTKTA